jgi:hypothetical protein
MPIKEDVLSMRTFYPKTYTLVLQVSIALALDFSSNYDLLLLFILASVN